MSGESSNPSKSSSCFLEQDTKPSLLGIVGSRNGFKCDLHKQNCQCHNSTEAKYYKLKYKKTIIPTLY